MNCGAKITDHFNHKYKCNNDAEIEVTTITTIPSSGKKVIKVRNLCKKHRKRLVHRFRYDVKHGGKACEIIEKPLNLTT